MKIRLILCGLFLCLGPFWAWGQSPEIEPVPLAIAFYNVENLFDLQDDPSTKDEEYTPEGANQWDKKRYDKKLKDLANVLSKINGDRGLPVVVGLAEVENRKVVEDLAKESALKKGHYKVAHFESPDERGIDVAMLYNPKLLKVIEQHSLRITLPDNQDSTTRDVLWVKALLAQSDTVYFFVNHWPSRRNPESARLSVATKLRQTVDSIFRKSPEALMIFMGDFNDTPTDASVRKLVGPGESHPNVLINPMLEFVPQGLGTYCYKGEWNVLDQFLLSPAWQNTQSAWGYEPRSTKIFQPEWLQQQDDKYKGWPHRTYVGSRYLGGFSDHFPIVLQIRPRD